MIISIITFIIIFAIILYTQYKKENAETEETDIFNSTQTIVPVNKNDFEIFQQTHNYLQNVNLNDVLNYARTSTEKSCKEVFINYLKAQVEQSAAKTEISLLKKQLQTLFQLSFDEKNYELAYNIILSTIYLDINEFICDHYDKMQTFNSLKLYIIWKSKKPEIPFKQFSQVTQLQEILNKDNKQLRLDFENVWYRIQLPFHLYTISECMDIFFAAKDGNIDALKQIYSSKEYITLGSSMGRLEEGYIHFENALKLQSEKNFNDARSAFLKADESFKQANATKERSELQKKFFDCVKEDPVFYKTLNYLSKFIESNPGILQSELIKIVQQPPHSISRDDASSTLYFADKFGMITRTKKGRSYELFIPENIINT